MPTKSSASSASRRADLGSPRSTGAGQKARPGAPTSWTRPAPRGFFHVCCDCGLTHKMNFRVGESGLAEYQMYVDDDARKLTQIGREHGNKLDAQELLEQLS
jgi:hypothetical protein